MITREFIESVNEQDVKTIIGYAYVNGVFKDENSKEIKEHYRTIAKINKKLFKLIPFPVVFVPHDPYESAKDMRERVMKDRVIYIYTGSNGHPFLSEKENNISRAVHDVFAHLVCGCPFTFKGEYNAYLEQRKYYPESVWNVLFSEIPAQTATYYYTGSFDYKQRAFEAPPIWLALCEKFKCDYSKNSVMKPFKNHYKECSK